MTKIAHWQPENIKLPMKVQAKLALSETGVKGECKGPGKVKRRKTSSGNKCFAMEVRPLP